MKVVKMIIAFFLPPLAAGIQVGLSKHFWINLILFFLFYVPGLIHAWWLILTDQQPPAGAR